MASFWGARCCCGTTAAACDMSDCLHSITDWASGDYITGQMICSDGTPASVSMSDSQDTSLGQPANSLKVNFQQSGTATDQTAAYFFVIKSGVEWNPTELGELASMVMCVEAIKAESSSISSVLVLPAIKQGSDYFITNAKTVSNSWRGLLFTPLAPASFKKLDPATFAVSSESLWSDEGAPELQFGIAIRVVIDPSDTDLSAEVNLDNYCLNFNGSPLCICTRTQELLIDVPGSEVFSGSFITEYFSTSAVFVQGHPTDSSHCRWKLDAGEFNVYVDIFIGSGGANYRLVRVWFQDKDTLHILVNYSNYDMGGYWQGDGGTGISRDDLIGELFECNTITLWVVTATAPPSGFPSTITIGPV